VVPPRRGARFLGRRAGRPRRRRPRAPRRRAWPFSMSITIASADVVPRPHDDHVRPATGGTRPSVSSAGALDRGCRPAMVRSGVAPPRPRRGARTPGRPAHGSSNLHSDHLDVGGPGRLHRDGDAAGQPAAAHRGRRPSRTSGTSSSSSRPSVPPGRRSRPTSSERVHEGHCRPPASAPLAAGPRTPPPTCRPRCTTARGRCCKPSTLEQRRLGRQ